jgi:hypothetical protein
MLLLDEINLRVSWCVSATRKVLDLNAQLPV